MSKLSSSGQRLFGLGGVGFVSGRRFNLDAVARVWLRVANRFNPDFIDTAPLYGAGRSERLIGRTMSHQIKVITKVGVPVEGMIQPRSFQKYKSTTQTDLNRVQLWEELFPPTDLNLYLRESLNRLRRPQVFAFILHAILPELQLPRYIDALRKIKRDGLAENIGFSQDGPVTHDTDWADLVELNLSQLPLTTCRQTSKRIYVVNQLMRDTEGDLKMAMHTLLALPENFWPVLGTSRLRRLRQFLNYRRL
jgi:aryl-alcohol dehydrogenase-like predicted oxidoreductase